MNNMNDVRSTLVAHRGATKVTREELREIPIPEATKSHQPLSHFEVVTVLEEALSYRHIRVVRDDYAVSEDGMKMFGVMDLDESFDGGRFSIGLRNSNDKSMRLALTAGYRVLVCDNMAFSGDFTPLLHKHTVNLNLRDSIAVAVDRIHRGFGTIGDQIKEMREFGLTDNDARLLVYRAFMERAIKGLSRQMMPIVHQNYFEPGYDDFSPRNLWSLSNAFTSAFKTLAPLKQFEATAKLGRYLATIPATLAGERIESDDCRSESLIDCGTGRFKLVEVGKDKFKEEMINSDDIDSQGSDRAYDDQNGMADG